MSVSLSYDGTRYAVLFLVVSFKGSASVKDGPKRIAENIRTISYSLVPRGPISMSGALGALRRSLTQAPKMARGIKTGQAVKGGGHDVSQASLSHQPSARAFRNH